jgi:hypothetical protein
MFHILLCEKGTQSLYCLQQQKTVGKGKKETKLTTILRNVAPNPQFALDCVLKGIILWSLNMPAS